MRYMRRIAYGAYGGLGTIRLGACALRMRVGRRSVPEIADSTARQTKWGPPGAENLTGSEKNLTRRADVGEKFDTAGPAKNLTCVDKFDNLT